MKKKTLLLILVLMFICTGASVSLIPDTVQAAITDHLAAIEIWIEHDLDNPELTDDDEYTVGLCFDADNTIEKISFLTPAGNSYEFDGEYVDDDVEQAPGVWLESGMWPDPENTMGYEWCYEKTFVNSDLLDDFGDGTYTITLHYADTSTEQTTACFGVPGTCDPIVQPTEVPAFTSFSDGATLTSPVTFEWDACSGDPLTATWFEIFEEITDDDIVEEYFPGCTVNSYGPVTLDIGDYEVDLGFETWHESVNSDGIDIGAGKAIESDYYITISNVVPPPPEVIVDLKDYGLSLWDFSGTYDEQPVPHGTAEFTLVQDAKGKITGSGVKSYYSSEHGVDIENIAFDIKGKVKGKNNTVTVKIITKGGRENATYDGDTYTVKSKDKISLELNAETGALVGTTKGKVCAKGAGCESGSNPIEIGLLPGMTGEAVVSINATPDGSGKKLEGTAELTLSNGDMHNLYAKGKSKNGETKLSLKGTNGIKFKLSIDEGSGDATGIKAKVLGQQLIY
jgi:hypothetical protein